MAKNTDSKDFFSKLREELINTQNIRFKLSFQKLLFIISLLGLGIIDTTTEYFKNFHFLIYFIPFVSFMFDLFIIGENFGIRRIGNFVKFTSEDDDEKYWEFLLNVPKDLNRDLFSSYGNKISSFFFIVLAAIVIVCFRCQPLNHPDIVIVVFESLWLIIVSVSFYIVWVRYPKKMNEKIIDFNRSYVKFKDVWRDLILKEKEIYKDYSNPELVENELIKMYKKDY